MKRHFTALAIFVLTLSLSIAPAMAQSTPTGSASESVVEMSELPDIKTDTKLKTISWDLDRLFDNALEQILDFSKDIPKSIKRISVVHIDGDESFYVNTASLKFKLQDALIKDGRFSVVECRQCNNMKVYVEDNSLILSRAIESNEQIAKLGKDLGIDAYIKGNVTINESIGKVQLGLMLIDIPDGTILKSTSLQAFHPKKRTPSTTPRDPGAIKNPEKEKTDLDLEILFPKLLVKVPGALANLPSHITRVAIAEFNGDDTYFINEDRMKELFETTLVNGSGLTIIECPTCAAQRKFALADASVFPTSVSSANRIKNLAEQLGFDAYIKSELTIHEDEKKIELGFKIIDSKDSAILSAVALKTADKERILEKESEHSIGFFLPQISLSGDVYFNGSGFDSSSAEQFLGFQYRYLTETLFDDFLIGFDITNYVPIGMPSSLNVITFLVKYRIPFEYNNNRLFNASFGYGPGVLNSSVEACSDSSKPISPVIIEIDSQVTSSLSVGFTLLSMGAFNMDFSDCSGFTPNQRFDGDGFAVNVRYNF